MKLRERGILFVISSPSGAGKTTATNYLVRHDGGRLVRSISVTTRMPRSGETDGLDYFFRTKEEFHSMCDQGELLEHAKVFNNYYGTPAMSVENFLARGIDVICAIDWQGAIQIQQKMQSISVFLLPPSIKTLQNRLFKRGKDTAITINDRLRKAKDEITNYNRYNYLLINDNFNETVDVLYSIIKAERSKRNLQTGAQKFINHLIKENIELTEE